MAEGGTYNGCLIDAIGRTKEEAVFYRAITQYLTATSGFNEAYTALNTACADLYGAGSSDCVNVKKALRSVELDQEGACSGLPSSTPECNLTEAPTITSISSTVANGSYKSGKIIDINLSFSEAVTSTGSATVNLNTGGSCNIDITGNSSGSCNYVVGATDNTDRLDVLSVSGIITDQDGNTMTNFSPASNLAQNNQIAIDNIAPLIGGVENAQTYRNDVNPIFNEGGATLNNTNFVSGQTVSEDGSYLLVVTDNAGNSSSANFIVEKVTSSMNSLPYTNKKTGQRLSFYFYGLNLPGKLKSRYFSLRLNGQKVKITSVRNTGLYIAINTKLNYRKWPVGNYNLSLGYNYKLKKIRYQGSANKNNILAIQ